MGNLTLQQLAKKGLNLIGLVNSVESELQVADAVTVKIPENALLIRGQNSFSFYPKDSLKAIKEYVESKGGKVNIEAKFPDLKKFDGVSRTAVAYVLTFTK